MAAERSNQPPPPGGAPRFPTMPAPSRVEYLHRAGPHLDRFLRGVARGVLTGNRCPSCGKVYVPCRGTCPTCGVTMGEDVALPDTGVITTFCIVNIPFEGQVLKPPYVCAHVRLDGADVPLFQLIGGCAPAEVRSGMRVRAAWVPEGERTPSLESIRWFEPIPTEAG